MSPEGSECVVLRGMQGPGEGNGEPHVWSRTGKVIQRQGEDNAEP